DECVRVRTRSIEIGGTRVADVMPVCISGRDDGVLMTYDVDAERTAFTLTLDELPFGARLSTRESTHSLDGRWPRLVATGAIDASGMTASARFSGGAVTWSEARLAASGFDGSAELRNGTL